MRHIIFIFLISVCFVKQVDAQSKETSGNPVFPGWYADPEGIIFDDLYWIYPTYSAPYNQQVFLDAFSSPDLVNWTKHPQIVDTAAVKWIWGAMWAPAIVKKDSLYFLFFGGNDIQNDNEYGGIGVAVSDRPEGPYKDYLGKPLIDKFYNGAQPIDQFVFKDQNGSYYMYYGGWKHCNVGRLNDDFSGFIPFPDGQIFREITPENYVEGPFMLIRNGKYYFMWSEGSWTGPDYSVAYAIGDSPLGPFKRIGKILQQNPEVATGAGHHSVIRVPGTERYYIVYHRRPLEETDGNHRVTCIDEMFFDENGLIQPVKITFEGVGAQLGNLYACNNDYSLSWGEPIYVADNDGDTWDPAWSDDDNLYTPINDTSGFGSMPRRNVSFGKLQGNSPFDLHGTTPNNMDEYGNHAEKSNDNRTWKTSGCISVDGVIYFAVGRHAYGHESGDQDKRQTAINTSIVKSHDKAKTWERDAITNLNDPMFKKDFCTPYFVYYGKDSHANDVPAEHQADKYVYAISNNGFWDNGDYYILGRIKKENMSALNPDLWEFLSSANEGNPTWGNEVGNAHKIISAPRQCGETGVTYIPSLKKYMLISWYYTGNGRDNTNETVFNIYLSDNLWSGWELISQKKNNPEGWYCPRILNKWQTVNADGSVTLYVCTAGDWKNKDYYRMTLLPLTISHH